MAEKKEKKDNKIDYLIYKDKKLVRSGDTIYYGNFSDKYIAVIQIRDTKEENGIKLATKVSVSLNINQKNMKMRLIKKAERESLYVAIDLAEYWLKEALEMDPS